MGVTWMQCLNHLIPSEVSSNLLVRVMREDLGGFMKMQENKNHGLSCTAWFLAVPGIQDPLEGPGSRDSLVGYQSFVCNMGLWKLLKSVFAALSRLESSDMMNITLTAAFVSGFDWRRRLATWSWAWWTAQWSWNLHALKRQQSSLTIKLHEFHKSNVRRIGGKLYTSPVLHRSSLRLCFNRVVDG